MRQGRARTLAAATAVALLVSACGGGSGDDTDTTDAAGTEDDAAMEDMEDMGSEDEMGSEGDHEGSEDEHDDDGGMDMDMSGSYGEPADAAEADRTIDVNVDNDLAFEPAEFEVAAGEVVTFRVANTGDVEHEFVLGDMAAQDDMAEAMDSGDDEHGHSGEMGNAVTIHPGETAELTWRFPDEGGEVLIGCHVPGHWEAGMRGTITVG